MVFNMKLFRKKISFQKILNKEKFYILAILFLVASVRVFIDFFPSSADANWYHADWKYRQKISTNSSLIDGNHNSYPLLVSITQDALKSIWSGGRVGKVNGGDILFTSSDGTTKLFHEIEKYSFNSGELIAWVKVPVLNDLGQDIYMYYGNESCSDQWDLFGNVWNDRYVAVYHLGDNCNTEGCYKDSVSGNNASPYSDDNLANLNDNFGKIGGAISLDGNRQYLKIPDSLDLDLDSNFTIEVFSQLNELNRYNSLFDKGSFSMKVDPARRYNFLGLVDPDQASFSLASNFGAGKVVTSMAIFLNHLFVTVFDEQSSNMNVYFSPDGQYFQSSGVFTVSESFGGLNVFKDRLYLFVDNTIYSSNNGSAWTSEYTISSDVFVSMVVFNNYLYAGTKENGRIYRSLIGTGGSSWNLVKDFNDEEMKEITTMTVYDGKLFMGGDNGRIYLTADGSNYFLDNDFGVESLITALGVFDGRLWVGVSDASLGNTYYRDFSGNYTMSNFPQN